MAQFRGLQDLNPDLNSLDSSFRATKDIAYQIAPTTRDDIMDRVRIACCAVTQQTLQGVIQNFKRRLALCVENEREL